MTVTSIKRRKRERLAFTVARTSTGALGLIPADGYTAKRMQERGYATGDKLLGDITKLRNPGFHRLAHRLGTLVAENIDEFSGLDAHAVLKRMQIEAGIACDEIPLFIDLMGQRVKVVQRIPQSLSFESMDESAFRGTVRAMSDYIAETYWPGLTGDAIERMAEAMPEAA